MCPPGVDQTERGPQCWAILVPRLQQQCSFSSPRIPSFVTSQERFFMPPSPGGTLFETGDHVWDAWSKLARPPRAAHDDSLQCYMTPHSRARFSTIESIPAEMLSLVLGAPSLSRTDIVAFGLASPTLWPHALRQIAHDCRDSAASWAGAEIANIGTYLTELPPQFEKDSCSQRRFIPGPLWCAQQGVGAEELDHKEYVRCRFDTGKQQAFVETEALPIPIEEALMLRICWTTSCYDWQEQDFSRGAWAGHAFDIVLADDEIPTMGREAWMEVTDEIVKEARKEHGLRQKMEEKYEWSA
ncbi:hypothetical protein G7Y79_00050g086240 [Physcia stellaris]|nr:hypothetical protein G7Y79_00050g086240 [Physcia stellaris]